MKKLYYHILNLLLKPLLKAEKPLNRVNERSVEYSFALEMIQKYCTGKILDVGTGKGSFPHLLYSCGYDVTAIDKKDTKFFGDVFCNRHFKVIDADITKGFTGKYQFITCISVLEHITEYQQAVANMVKLLDEGGYLLLTVPFTYNKYNKDVYEGKEKFITQVFNYEFLHYVIPLILDTIDARQFKVFTGNTWNDGERINPVEVLDTKDCQLMCLLLKHVKHV